MRLLVVIPARGGSKGIPRKNLVECAGEPLIYWTIDHAEAAAADLATGKGPDAIETGIIVSTDDAEIAGYVRERWPRVSVLDRPAELATDTALTAPVVAHALKSLDRFPGARPDLVAVLQPTVPARQGGLLTDCVYRLLDSGADSLLTAYPLHFVWWRESSMYAYDKDSGHASASEWRTQCPRRPRRQDMTAREKMYAEDGAVFLAKADLIRQTGEYVGGRCEIYQTIRTVDIDDEVDLALADALLSYRKVVAEGTCVE